MNKFKFIAIALIMFLSASCSKDSSKSPQQINIEYSVDIRSGCLLSGEWIIEPYATLTITSRIAKTYDVIYTLDDSTEQVLHDVPYDEVITFPCSKEKGWHVIKGRIYAEELYAPFELSYANDEYFRI